MSDEISITRLGSSLLLRLTRIGGAALETGHRSLGFSVSWRLSSCSLAKSLLDLRDDLTSNLLGLAVAVTTLLGVDKGLVAALDDRHLEVSGDPGVFGVSDRDIVQGSLCGLLDHIRLPLVLTLRSTGYERWVRCCSVALCCSVWC